MFSLPSISSAPAMTMIRAQSGSLGPPLRPFFPRRGGCGDRCPYEDGSSRARSSTALDAYSNAGSCSRSGANWPLYGRGGAGASPLHRRSPVKADVPRQGVHNFYCWLMKRQPPALGDADGEAPARYWATLSPTTASYRAAALGLSDSTTLCPSIVSKPLNGLVMNVRSLPRRSRNSSAMSESEKSLSTVIALVIACRKALSLVGLLNVPELAALSRIALRNCCWCRSRLMSPSGNWYRCRM